MIITQVVISVLIHRPGSAPKPLNFQDVCLLRPGNFAPDIITGDIPRLRPPATAFSSIAAPGAIIFNRGKQFPHSSAPST